MPIILQSNLRPEAQEASATSVNKVVGLKWFHMEIDAMLDMCSKVMTWVIQNRI